MPNASFFIAYILEKGGYKTILQEGYGLNLDNRKKVITFAIQNYMEDEIKETIGN